MRAHSWSALALAILGLALPALAANQAIPADAGTLDEKKAAQAHPAKPPYSPYAGRSFPSRPLFGDTQLHTSYSMDAGTFGARLGPRDAYRFARGEQLTSSTGQPVKLSRPLDFLVVADHSDNMGLFPMLASGSPQVVADPSGRRWHEMIQSGEGGKAAFEIIAAWRDPDFDPKQRAFYYARVMEIQTPRWTAFDAVRYGSKPVPGTRMTVSERAYTSPIWYTP